MLWQKRSDGTLGITSRVLLLPLHFLNWLPLRVAIISEKGKPFHEVQTGLWLGRRLLNHEAEMFCESGQIAVLDLTSEFPKTPIFCRATYLCVPTLDHTSPTEKQVAEALEFIETHIPNGRVYVHCALGHGRSATVVAAWLLRKKVVTSVDSAVTQLKSSRSGVSLNLKQVAMLKKLFPC
jgi:hypothetical protein